MCPAWGQMCKACGKQNHLEMVCQLKDAEKRGAMRCIGDEKAAMDAFIARIVFDPVTGIYKLGNSDLEELEATIIPFFPCLDPRQIRDIPAAHPTRLKITLIVVQPYALVDLYTCGTWDSQKGTWSPLKKKKKKVHTIGGFSLVCQGWLPVTFEIGSQTTKQALYICKKIQVIYFSKAACIDVRILPLCFPRPMTSPPSVTCDAIHPGTQPNKTEKP